MEPVEVKSPVEGMPQAEACEPGVDKQAETPVPQSQEPQAETPVTQELAEQILLEATEEPKPAEESNVKGLIEAIIYVAEEPVTAAQIAAVIQESEERVRELLAELTAEYAQPGRGLVVREVAGGYKMGTRPEHHEGIRAFARSLKPPLKLSLAALETLAVIAYKQPITAPEIQEIRGVQGAGVLKTLLDRKLIATAGRKQVVGKPILYKTTKEFLLQFGLKDLAELPTLKEFEELRRLAFNEAEPEPVDAQEAPAETAADAASELEPDAEPAPVAEAAPDAETAPESPAAASTEQPAVEAPEPPGENA